ncbi:tRNA (N6-isopentenyl adenosine(37)-C2)-methylthiotransferase MiaB [Aurantibacillus circumpalustris]|uniref:tRNA (N6-isopentenyl adenosine(37)-C2)-methylthiotransferase MiaB n=1 Tax=Aurantibacillus circumpalustris TaxID=3036359 RepID=UPI00295B272C|nr:tRNA (N6-isopentenyl adenosine(37)-C2)-methylthiotransferase MiaB [Aurantibacillus circumpalustris]
MNSETKIIDEKLQGTPFMVDSKNSTNKKLFLESYGCQMNFADSEIVASILMDKGYSTTDKFEDADVIFLNTCAIRENAELRVRNRLNDFKKAKKNNPKLLVGVLGCMAERLKSQFLEQEKLVDIVVGPDAYRDLPGLIEEAEDGHKAINVILSKEETYADLTPVRLGSNGVNAYISIMRGCDNMCSFCVVPFTRGRERSRDPESIVAEAKDLFEKGYREVTLLGQNVDSYLYTGGGLKKETLTEEQKASAVSFAQLLERVALIDPLLRVRYSTSHPKDMTDDVLEMVAKYHNICNYIHLPVQSGSSRILEMMNRGYTREWYLERMAAINRIIPGCGISTDIITGFCSETEEDHQQTISLMKSIQFDYAYMFSYSERPKTLAERKYPDDVTAEVKSRRLAEIVELQRTNSGIKTALGLGKVHEVLVEGFSKKSDDMLMGRNPQNTVVVFPKGNYKKGDYVNVMVTKCTTSTLIGEAV